MEHLREASAPALRSEQIVAALAERAEAFCDCGEAGPFVWIHEVVRVGVEKHPLSTLLLCVGGFRRPSFER